MPQPQFLTAHTNGVGLIVYKEIDQTVDVGDLVYLKSNDHYALADAATPALTPCVAVALEPSTPGKNTPLLFKGILHNSAFSFTGGDILYLGETPGQIVATAPTTSGSRVQRIGHAISANEILFEPNLVDIGNK